MNQCQPIKDDDVTEALSSVANNSGSIPRIRQKPIGWSFEDWKRCFQHGSGKIRFGCCTDNLGNSQYLRAVQGHSGGAKLDAKLQSNIKMPCGRTNISVDLLCDYWSIVEGCRIAGGNQQSKRKARLRLHSCRSDVHPTIRRKRTTNDSIHNEMEKL